MKTTSIINKKAEESGDASQYETLALSIDANGVEHLMSTLTNLYSDPVESVFREYVSNALDSHIKAKNKAPIKVDLIRGYNASLRVQDFGTGMDKNDIVNVYSKYASSTKRDSNEQIGAFGLGAKSALAIADRFDVTSIKDGVELVFFIKKNSRGVGVVHFVSEGPTTKANGVTVEIPITQSHLNDLIALTEEKGFFSTWDPKLVIFDGLSIESSSNVYNEDAFLPLYSGKEILGWVNHSPAKGPRSYSYTQGNISLTISGIRYKMEGNILSQTLSSQLENLVSRPAFTFFQSLNTWKYNVILNLPIGSVDLTPSRENIMLTAKTRATLKVALEAAATEIPRVITSKLNKVPFEDAFSFYADNLPAFGIPNGSTGGYEYWPNFFDPFAPIVKYKGETIKPSLPFATVILQSKNASTWDDKWYVGKEINYFALKYKYGVTPSPLNTQHGSFYTGVSRRSQHFPVLVYGTDTEENRAIIKRNARSYGLSEGSTAYVTVYFYTNETAPTNPWLTNLVKVITISELETIGKAYRSQKSKEAAANRTATTQQRPVAIHYGAAYDKATDTYDIRKYSPDEIKAYKEVILISMKEEDEYTTRVWYNPANSIAVSFWSEISTMFDSTAMDQYSEYHVLRRLAKLFSESLIIAVPKARSTGPVLKANENTITLAKAIENRFKEITKNEKDKALLTAISEATVEHYSNEAANHGIRFLIDSLHKHGLIKDIENEETKAVFENIANASEYSELVLLGRIFINLTPESIKNKAEKYTIIGEYLRQNGTNPTDGMEYRYSFINTRVDETRSTPFQNAQTFLALVNAIDTIKA